MSSPRIILVMSGKGGVGKSSVTTQLALSFALAGKCVGVLDVDLTGPSIPRLFSIEDGKITQSSDGLVPVQVHDSRTDETGNTLTYGSVHAISLGLILPTRSTAVIWRGPKKTAMVRQLIESTAWPVGTEYVLIDTPPGTSDEHISLLETLIKNEKPVVGAVMVTTPQQVALADVRKSLDFCQKTGLKVCGLIENMSGYVCPACKLNTDLFGSGGGHELAVEKKIKFLGRVPVDPTFVALIEKWDGQVVVEDGSDSDSDVEQPITSSGPQSPPSVRHHHHHVPPDPQPPLDPSAPLVERYASCSLAPIFARITSDLLQDIAGSAIQSTP